MERDDVVDRKKRKALSEWVDHPAALDPDQLLKQCKVTRGRASGPGGQHRNKVETAVAILHESSGVVGQASERRSQSENRKVAVRRLRVNLAMDLRIAREKLHEPSELWQSRLRGGKIVVSVNHSDFPAILSEALDVIEAHGHEPKPAATVLGCSMSQLLKLLKAEPRAFSKLNEKRKQKGLRSLR